MSEDQFDPGVYNTLGNTHIAPQPVDDIHPYDAQFDLCSGDKAVIVGLDNDREESLTVLELLDAEEHSSEFPDWEDRIMRKYVLGNWKSVSDRVGDIGWFHLSQLIPMSEDQYQEISALLNGDPEEFHTPEWIIGLYDSYTDSMNKMRPDIVPKMSHCKVCGSPKVLMLVNLEIRVQQPAGELLVDGQQIYTPMGTGDIEKAATCELHCTECHATKQLDIEDVRVRRNTPLERLIREE